MHNHYNILGVEQNATQDEIKKAYKRQARKYHPDRNKSSSAEELFKIVQASYLVLSDQEKRAVYDRSLNRSHQPRRKQYNKTITSCSITLKDSYKGIATILQNRKIRITPGIRNNTIVQVNNEMVRILIQPHEIFKRTNDDLLLIAEIDAIEALVGTDLRFTHLNGQVMQYRIRPGTNHDQVVKFSTKGMPNPETGKYGDLLVQFKINVPYLTKDQRELIISLKSRDLIEK